MGSGSDAKAMPPPGVLSYSTFAEAISDMSLSLAYTSMNENAQLASTKGIFWNRMPATARTIAVTIRTVPRDLVRKGAHFIAFSFRSPQTPSAPEPCSGLPP